MQGVILEALADLLGQTSLASQPLLGAAQVAVGGIGDHTTLALVQDERYGGIKRTSAANALHF